MKRQKLCAYLQEDYLNSFLLLPFIITVLLSFSTAIYASELSEEEQLNWKLKGFQAALSDPREAVYKAAIKHELADIFFARQSKEAIREAAHLAKLLDDEDRMVGLFNHCIYDLESKAPSIDTPLHGLLPFKHIDHLHPDALIAIAAAKDSEKITKDIWAGTMGWVPWQRPGFDLALQLEKCLEENPGIKGIVLGSHGLFTWGDTSYDCYINSLEVIEQASEYIENKIKDKGVVFGGQKIQGLAKEERLNKAAQLAPILRGLCSSENRMIGHFTDDDVVLEFINSNDINRLV